MELEHSIVIGAPIEKIWDVVGHRFVDVYKWISVVSSSKVKNNNVDDDKTLDDAPCSGRICATSYGKVEETITHYDEDGKKISYDAKAEKMSFFVKGLHNTWSMTSLGEGQTKVSAYFKMEISFPFNVIAGFMMKSQMTKTMRSSLEELKHYVEIGKPHPRNIKSEKNC